MIVLTNLQHSDENTTAEFAGKYFALDVAIKKFLEKLLVILVSNFLVAYYIKE